MNSSAPVTHDDQIDALALEREDVPDGFIRTYPDRRRDVRFAVAIPTLVTLFVLTASAGLWAAGLAVDATLPAATWSWAVPAVTLVSMALAIPAARAGWSDDRPAGPFRPLAYGLLTGLAVQAFGISVIGFTASYIV